MIGAVLCVYVGEHVLFARSSRNQSMSAISPPDVGNRSRTNLLIGLMSVTLDGQDQMFPARTLTSQVDAAAFGIGYYVPHNQKVIGKMRLADDIQLISQPVFQFRGWLGES